MSDKRTKLLERWAGSLIQAAATGALTGGKVISILSVETVRGPRAGALEIHAGLDSGKLLQVLSVNDYALHRQFVPWRFAGEPSVYLVSRYVRLEAAWPDELAERDIKLADIAQHPKDGGRWIAGKNETGATVTLGLSDRVPHYLIGGWTGSGKTWAIRSTLAQLSRDAENRLVLVDAKWGDGLGCLGHLPRLVGPVATDIEGARAALSWAVAEMRRRYETGNKPGRIIVAIDEIQELTGKAGDAAATEMIRRLVVQGRGARVHCIIGTQHPTLSAFSDPAIKRNLTGRVALRTEDYKASEVVVGGPSPRADRLLGAGDCYCLTPSATHRAQLAYIPQAELEAMNTGKPELDAWPDFDPKAAGTLPDEDTARWEYSGEELAVALVQAHLGNGRPLLVKALDAAGLGKPGSVRAARLLDLGRSAHNWLVTNDWQLSEAACLPGSETHTP